MREKGKKQIHRELSDKVNKHRRSQERVGNAVQLAEGQKQERGQIANHGHGQIAGIAGVAQSSVLGIHKEASCYKKVFVRHTRLLKSQEIFEKNTGFLWKWLFFSLTQGKEKRYNGKNAKGEKR